MVYTPRRRRLFRAIFVGLIFAGCVLLFERWNSTTSGPLESNYVPRIAKYGHDPLDAIYHERKTTRRDVNVTKVVVVNQKKQIHIKKPDVTKKPNITWIKHPWTSSLRGFLNVHVWLDWCGSTVNDLRRNIHFPQFPDIRLKTKLFHLSHDAHNFGQRVFGFLHPPKTGRYTFAISSDDCSELWLSSDDDPKNAQLIAWVGNLSDPFWQGIVGDGEFTKYESQISGQIFLRRNRRYFVEALHKQSTSSDHLLVAWKIPRVGNFSHITRGRISQYIHPHELHNLEVTRYARHIPLTPAVLQKSIILQKLRDQMSVDILNPGQNPETPISSDAHLYRRDDYRTEKRDRNRNPIGKSDQFSPTEKKDLSSYSAGKRDQLIKDFKQNLKDFIFDTKFRQSIAHKMYHSCDYNPSYRVDFNVARYEGVYLIHETAVYPDDRTHLKHVEYYKPCYEMRSTDSHGQMLPGVDQSEFGGNEMDVSEDGWNERREEEGNNVESEGERLKKRESDSDQIIDAGGNIATVNYRDHRRVRDIAVKSNFSGGKRFHKRKILAILDSGNKNTNNSRHEHMLDGRRVTSRLAVTSPRSHDNNSQGNGNQYGGNDNEIDKRKYLERGIEHGSDLKKSEIIVITESMANSDDSMVNSVKKSAKTSDYEIKNSSEKPVKRIGKISNDRINGGSERKISKSTRTKAGKVIEGKSRESLERPLDTVERISNARINVHSTPTFDKASRLKADNGQMNEDFMDREQQGQPEKVRNNDRLHQNFPNKGNYISQSKNDESHDSLNKREYISQRKRIETEDKTVDGETEDKTVDGETEDKTVDGETEDKTVDGETEDKTVESETEDKTVDGETEDKTVDGETEDKTVDSPKRKLERRKPDTFSETKISISQDKQNIVKEKRINNSTPETETWERLKERIKRRKAERRASQGDIQVRTVERQASQGDNQVRIVDQQGIKEKKDNNSLYNDEAKLWHQKRHNSRRTESIFVDDSSPLALTFRKLKESGQWAEIKKYAERNGLLLTKKTWMYVTWKFLRYEKPKKPHDKLVEFVYKQNPPKCRTDGNVLLNEKVAKGIVYKYMKDLRKRYGSNVYLRRIVNIEENHDVIKGDRYLIELDLGLSSKNETIRVSDYVYLPLGGQSFCSPQDFVWRKNVTVHVIVPVKDQGKWVQHFINDMSELYETTQDPNVNVIIVDFNSTDIDIEQALKQSSLKRYRFLQVNGSFQRALGVQIGADAVENPDDIIFTCDLHLDIPNNMIDVIRKHCIQGKMAFSPMVLRLECGFTPTLPFGEWETMGYGLFAIYKSDFDRIGGMNIDEFKTKWGGEDWEMVDRCLQKGMEIERLRAPEFYHYFHSKQGMWGSYGFEDNVSGNIGDNIVEDELVPVYDEEEDNAIGYSYNQPLMPEY